MGVNVEFSDFSATIKDAIKEYTEAFLEEAGNELESTVKRNTRVDLEHTKESFAHIVSGDKVEIGSPLENAIWEEFGTGEYALEGSGRKGGWTVPVEKLTPTARVKLHWDGKSKKIFTMGKKPSRALHRAFESKKAWIKRRAKEMLKEGMK